MYARARSVSRVAPPRGERGLKFRQFTDNFIKICRSPSWGAWIEIHLSPLGISTASVAPPRGERGLKYIGRMLIAGKIRRSPSWGAWIEISLPFALSTDIIVAPPRGERGLKSAVILFCVITAGSLPLVGSVD